MSFFALFAFVVAQQNLRVVFSPSNQPLLGNGMNGGADLNKIINGLFGDSSSSMPFSHFSNLLTPATSAADSDKALDNIMSSVSGMDIAGLKLTNKATVPDNCRAEANQLCPPPALEGLRCMAQHHSQLSLACRDSIKYTVPFVCDEMISLHCDGLDSGILGCLESKREQLHPPCRDAVESTIAVVDKINNSSEVHLVDDAGTIIHTVKAMGPTFFWFPSFTSLGFLLLVIAFILIWRQQEIIRHTSAGGHGGWGPKRHQECELKNNEYGAI